MASVKLKGWDQIREGETQEAMQARVNNGMDIIKKPLVLSAFKDVVSTSIC
jgi:hypothetical protein